MKYYLHFFTAIFILSSAGFATQEEQEVSRKFGKKGNSSTRNKDQNPSQSENLTCRVPYVSQHKQFVGVDKERDMALFRGPKSNQGFFERLSIVLFNKK